MTTTMECNITNESSGECGHLQNREKFCFLASGKKRFNQLVLFKSVSFYLYSTIVPCEDFVVHYSESKNYLSKKKLDKATK